MAYFAQSGNYTTPFQPKDRNYSFKLNFGYFSEFHESYYSTPQQSTSQRLRRRSIYSGGKSSNGYDADQPERANSMLTKPTKEQVPESKVRSDQKLTPRRKSVVPPHGQRDLQLPNISSNLKITEPISVNEIIETPREKLA